jgi:hypothetical protein
MPVPAGIVLHDRTEKLGAQGMDRMVNKIVKTWYWIINANANPNPA